MTAAFFAPLPVGAIGDTRLSASHWRVLAAIASFDRLNKNGQGCWVKHEKIAENAKVHLSTVSHVIAELVAWNYVEQARQPMNRRLRTYRLIYKDNPAIHAETTNNRAGDQIHARSAPIDAQSANDSSMIVGAAKHQVADPKEEPDVSIFSEGVEKRTGSKFRKTGLHDDVELEAPSAYSRLRERVQRLVGERDGLIALANLSDDQLDNLMHLEGAGDLDDSTLLAELRRC